MSLASVMYPLWAKTAPIPFAAQMLRGSLLSIVLYIVRALSWYFFSFSLSCKHKFKLQSQHLLWSHLCRLMESLEPDVTQSNVTVGVITSCRLLQDSLKLLLSRPPLHLGKMKVSYENGKWFLHLNNISFLPINDQASGSSLEIWRASLNLSDASYICPLSLAMQPRRR